MGNNLLGNNLLGNNLMGHLVVQPEWARTNLLGHMGLIKRELITNNLVSFDPGKTTPRVRKKGC